MTYRTDHINSPDWRQKQALYFGPAGRSTRAVDFSLASFSSDAEHTVQPETQMKQGLKQETFLCLKTVITNKANM